MSNIDGHVVGPLDDQHNKIERNDPSFTNSESLVAPKFPDFKFNSNVNSPFNFNPNNIQQYVEDALSRVRINGQSASFNGGSINFDIPLNRTIQAPLISETIHPPSILIPPIISASGAIAPIQSEIPPQTVLNNQGQPIQNQSNVLSPNNNTIEMEVIGVTTYKPTIEEMPISSGSTSIDNSIAIKDKNNYENQESQFKLDNESAGVKLNAFNKDLNLPLAISGGDTSFFTSNYVPILLTRGDKKRKILSYILEDNSYVVEGAVAEDKTGTMPDDDSYYISGDVNHFWKVSYGDLDGITQSYNVKGGVATIQGEVITVDDDTVSGDGDGFIALKIERDSSSRAYVADSAAIEWSATDFVSDNESEYYVLAEVNGGVLKQHRFEEIISYELLIVENGEFKLAPFSILTRNTYNPPT